MRDTEIKSQISVARGLLDSAPTLNLRAALLVTEQAVRMMRPHFSPNNPELGRAYVQLAELRYRLCQLMSGQATWRRRRRLLSGAIKAKKAAVNVFAMGMSTINLGQQQVQLSNWLFEAERYSECERQLEAARATIRTLKKA